MTEKPHTTIAPDGQESASRKQDRVQLTDAVIGQKFSMWTVVAIRRQARSKVLCRCDCGSERWLAWWTVKAGETKSCGCAAERMRAVTRTKHGYAGTPTYQTWTNMKGRCGRPSHTHYEYYGARGIRVCERWMKFKNFLEDMGVKPDGHSIDRIDNSKGYEPGNCRWATHKQQMNNFRRNHVAIIGGQERTLSEWADASGTNYGTVHSRLRRGKPIEEAIFKAAKPRKKRLKGCE